MSDKPRDPKVITLDDLERRHFWAAIILLIGVAITLFGAMEFSRTLHKSLDQTQELSERVERLSAPAAAESKSEPTKASPSSDKAAQEKPLS